MMELIILGLVISAFGRGAQMSGKSLSLMRLAGGLIYLLLLGVLQIFFGIMFAPSPSSIAASLLVYIAILGSNAATIWIVLSIAEKFFGKNPFELTRFFRALNIAIIIFGIVWFLGSFSDTSSGDKAMLWQMGKFSVIVMIFAATLLVELRFGRTSKKVTALRWTLAGANALLIALAILSVMGKGFMHPIAFFFIEVYFSAWISLVACINIRVLSCTGHQTYPQR